MTAWRSIDGSFARVPEFSAYAANQVNGQKEQRTEHRQKAVVRLLQNQTIAGPSLVKQKPRKEQQEGHGAPTSGTQ